MQMTTAPTAELGYLIGELGWNKKRAKLLVTLWGTLLPLSLIAVLTIIGIPAFVAHLWFVQRSFQRLKSSQPILTLYEKGLVDNRQNKAVVLHYADIRKVYMAINTVMGQRFHDYTVHTQTGGCLKFGIEVASTNQLGEAIQEGMLASQLQRHLSDLENGESISFDNLCLSAKGLTLRNKQLSWQDFQYAKINTLKTSKFTVNCLDIHQKNQDSFWARFHRNKFPNLFLFFALTEYFSQ
ncbi:hypothetical protein IQ260_06060 [Leptolyngbya cf. ectocarpi LEGE 11479]|uniref:Uncharacterized protein n=1 Tax=Leptolyngbya cf. ectocarpi LEGE 11479 TaxID=1828722 RepID=A0A928X0I2_LEPEC|nr:DUF6585 family protein [Leptolyngbya ectocarpi]MBE9066212.1 hypothetical protein [Leptolyngbya cf. ectocarpi LEGE 11479]